MNEAMLDLETFGKDSNAVIIQIGACYFNRNTGEIGETIELNVDAHDEILNGFSVHGQTIYWWLGQTEAARKAILDAPKITSKEAILKFNEFCKNAKQIWSHASFDFNIIMSHFHKFNIKPSFHYRAARDIRTLVDLANIPYKKDESKPREGIAHTALDDCKNQVKYCVECFNKLKV